MSDKTEKNAEVKLTDKQLSAIDALAKKAALKVESKAKEAKPAKETKADKGKGSKKADKKSGDKAAKVDPKAKAAEKAKKDADRAAAKAKRDEERAAKKAARDKERAEKKAAKEAAKTPAHLGKVDKAGAKLPTLDESGKEAFDLVTSANLTEGQMATLVAHLAHFNRRRATIRSLSTKLEVGQTVTIVSSDRDPRLIGRTGTITQVRKIRVLVNIGGKRDAYLFTADVAPIAAPAANTLEVPAPEPTPEFLTPEAEATPAEPTGTEGK